MAELVHEFIVESAGKYADHPAVIHDEQRIAYSQLYEWVSRLAAFLQHIPVAKGDRVCLLLENSVAYLVAYYATLLAGGVVVPLSTDLKPRMFASLLEEIEPAAVITSKRFERFLNATEMPDPSMPVIISQPTGKLSADVCEKVFEFETILSSDGPDVSDTEIHPQDLASIIYTSGSTGTPKGVMLSHRNIVSNTLAICDYQDLSHEDIHMVVLPFFYVMGSSLLNTHMAVGGTLVLNNRFAYIASVLKQMVEEKVTGLSGVPSTFAYLLHRSPLGSYCDKLTSLRFCAQAGGHMSRKLKTELRRVLPEKTKLFIMYGATEASARISYLDPLQFEKKMNSIGKPIAGVHIHIMNEHGDRLPPGQEGELVVNGPNIMSGYWKQPESTSRVLDNHGYHTGDLGYCDDDGFFFVTGRKDGLIKVSGHRLNPEEIEEAFMESGLLIDVVVMGIPDPLQGTSLYALAEPIDSDTSEPDLLQRTGNILPAFKLPRRIFFTRALPKRSSGKVDRKSCKDYIIKSMSA
jgi:acyl-CoA synthetase (AMP-forming)/AMP-acid ligase II